MEPEPAPETREIAATQHRSPGPMLGSTDTETSGGQVPGSFPLPSPEPQQPGTRNESNSSSGSLAARLGRLSVQPSEHAIKPEHAMWRDPLRKPNPHYDPDLPGLRKEAVSPTLGRSGDLQSRLLSPFPPALTPATSNPVAMEKQVENNNQHQ